MFPWAAPHGDGNASLAHELQQFVERAIPRDSRPQAVLVCANGYSTRGDLAWMNGAIFHRDPRVACERLRPRFGELFVAPLPGETLRLEHGHRIAAVSRSEWIEPAAESTWPTHGGGAPSPPSFRPATGIERLDDSARDALARALNDFAAFLYASSLFVETYLLDAGATQGRRPTMAFVLREAEQVADGGDVWVWDPNGCSFSREELKRPEDELVAGVRCWASDLLAVLQVKMPAASLTMGRMTAWNALPAQLRFDLPNLLHMYCHPLRAPERFLALYRGLLSGQPSLVAARSEATDPIGSIPT